MNLSIILPLVSAGAAAIFAAYSLVRAVIARKGLTGVGFANALLAVGAGLGGAALRTLNAADAAATPYISYAAYGLIAAGALSVAVEALRGGVRFDQSPGLVGVGAGGLLLVGILSFPLVTDQLQQTTLATAAAMSEQIQIVSQTHQDVTEVAANIIISTPVPAATRMVPTATPTPTPFVYVAVTPAATTPAAASSTVCAGVVTANLNLRGEPTVDGDLLVTIPYSTQLTVTARSDDGLWLQTDYQDQQGWVSQAYVTLGENCQR